MGEPGMKKQQAAFISRRRAFVAGHTRSAGAGTGVGRRGPIARPGCRFCAPDRHCGLL